MRDFPLGRRHLSISNPVRFIRKPTKSMLYVLLVYVVFVVLMRKLPRICHGCKTTRKHGTRLCSWSAATSVPPVFAKDPAAIIHLLSLEIMKSGQHSTPTVSTCVKVNMCTDGSFSSAHCAFDAGGEENDSEHKRIKMCRFLFIRDNTHL